MYSQIRKQGYAWNHKRVYRVYRELKLNLRIKPKKRIPVREKNSLIWPIRPNVCWSIDFMSGSLISGEKFRTLNVIDERHVKKIVSIKDKLSHHLSPMFNKDLNLIFCATQG